MSLQISIRSNTISPGLAKAAAAVKDKRPILEAMGTQLGSLTKRAFNDSSLRVASWPNKKTGEPSRLKEKGAPYQSIRITNVGSDSVTVGSDRKYAAIHQLGGTIMPKNPDGLLVFKIGGKLVRTKKVRMPPRPFFAFLAGRMITSAAQKITATAMRKIQALMPK
ncbi:MAG TPA: phage virion morphogenesis protein [Terrimicrobiaceae bacterium]